MKKQFVLVIYAILTVIWLAVCIGFTSVVSTDSNYWIGFIAGVLGIIAATILTVLIPMKMNDSITEINSIHSLIGFGYVFIVLVINIVCMLLNNSNVIIAILITSNVILLAAYIYFAYLASHSAMSIAKKVELISEKTNNTAVFSMMLASFISIAQDQEVKAKVYTLKQKVDYSSNVSQSFTKELEEEFERALQTVGDDIKQGKGKDETISDIEYAERIWNDRCARLSAVR